MTNCISDISTGTLFLLKFEVPSMANLLFIHAVMTVGSEKNYGKYDEFLDPLDLILPKTQI